MLEKEKRTTEELHELRRAQNAIEQEAPGLKMKLEQYRVELANPLVSEDTYLEIKSRPEKKRNLREFVQFRVYEVVKTYRAQLEKSRREAEDLRGERDLTKERFERERKEMLTLQKIMQDRDEDHARRIEAIETRNAQLQEELQRHKRTEDRLKEKERSYDALRERLEELEKANTNLALNTDLQKGSAQRAEQKEDQYESTIQGL